MLNVKQVIHRWQNSLTDNVKDPSKLKYVMNIYWLWIEFNPTWKDIDDIKKIIGRRPQWQKLFLNADAKTVTNKPLDAPSIDNYEFTKYDFEELIHQVERLIEQYFEDDLEVFYIFCNKNLKVLCLWNSVSEIQ